MAYANLGDNIEVLMIAIRSIKVMYEFTLV